MKARKRSSSAFARSALSSEMTSGRAGDDIRFPSGYGLPWSHLRRSTEARGPVTGSGRWLVNMLSHAGLGLSSSRPPERFQARPWNGGGCRGDAYTEVSKPRDEFVGVPGGHREDGLPDPDDPGSMNESRLLPDLARNRALPPEYDLTDTGRNGPSRARNVVR